MQPCTFVYGMSKAAFLINGRGAIELQQRHTACKAENVYYLDLYKQSLLTSALEENKELKTALDTFILRAKWTQLLIFLPPNCCSSQLTRVHDGFSQQRADVGRSKSSGRLLDLPHWGSM